METLLIIYFCVNILTLALGVIVMGIDTSNIVSFKEICKYYFEECILFPYSIFMYFIYDYNAFGSFIIAFLSLFIWGGVLISGLLVFAVTSVGMLFNFLFKRKEDN